VEEFVFISPIHVKKIIMQIHKFTICTQYSVRQWSNKKEGLGDCSKTVVVAIEEPPLWKN